MNIKNYFEKKTYNKEGIDEELISAVKDCFVNLEGSMNYKDAVDFIKKNPDLLNFSGKDLKARFNEYVKCGWTKAQVTSAYSKNKNLMHINLQDLKDKVMIFKNLGMSANTLIKNPMLLSCPSADIKLKYMLGNLIGYNFDVKYFIQAFQKSFARASFLKEKNESIDYNLILSEKKFEKKFNISNNELKAKYALTNKEINKLEESYAELTKNKNLPFIELTDEEQKTCINRNKLKDLKKLFKEQNQQEK